MSTPTAEPALIDVLEDLIDVRPFPVTASRVMSACDAADVTANDLSEIITQDPALSVKLLQVANSPLYGFGGEVRSVQHAAVLIGLRTLKNLVLSMAMGDVFGSGSSLTAQARDQLWMHALGTGSIARTVATTTQIVEPDEAFLAGILHDVGKLIFVDHRPEDYTTLLQARPPRATVVAEEEYFGITHTAIGRTCGENWGLPDELSDVITFHHDPADSDFGGELVEVVCAANRLTRVWDTENCSNPEVGCLDAGIILQEAGIDLSPEEIEQLQQQAISDLKTVRETQAN